MDIRKHWISLREAHSELMGWQDKWYKWYYPYSKWLSVGKGFLIGMAAGAGILCAIHIVKYFNL